MCPGVTEVRLKWLKKSKKTKEMKEDPNKKSLMLMSQMLIIKWEIGGVPWDVVLSHRFFTNCKLLRLRFFSLIHVYS